MTKNGTQQQTDKDNCPCPACTLRRAIFTAAPDGAAPEMPADLAKFLGLRQNREKDTPGTLGRELLSAVGRQKIAHGVTKEECTVSTFGIDYRVTLSVERLTKTAGEVVAPAAAADQHN